MFFLDAVRSKFTYGFRGFHYLPSDLHNMSPPAQQEPQEQWLGPRSVIIDNLLYEDRWGPWLKLADHEVLAQLHAKYWRKSMLDEEKEWRRKQESDFDASIHGCDGSDRMIDDVDGDIGPGCYVLDIGIDDLPIQKVWIRSDYIRMYDYCSNHYERTKRTRINQMAPSVVITGQPGIGRFSFRFINP